MTLESGEMAGAMPAFTLKNEATRWRWHFITISEVIFWFINTELKQIYSNKFICTPRKFRRVFFDFCYYFLGQHCSQTETCVIGNDFLFFYNFPLPSITTAPLPYFCSGVPTLQYSAAFKISFTVTDNADVSPYFQ